MKAALTVAISIVLIPHGAAAQRANSSADATVFIRLIGNVHAEINEAGVKQSADVEHVEIATGSGFVISPYGYVLTNDHVISNNEQLVVSNPAARQVKLTFAVSKIDVCLPPGAAAMQGVVSPCSEATVVASDPALDLAALFVVGRSNVPYLPLGDSDVVKAGLNVDALGYPFGRQLEVGKITMARDLVPEVTTTAGTISALRAGDGGERRYLQITNNLNPGNSGGPLVDRDGYAIGVIRMKVTSGVGIGFAIAINEVKDFLESHGLDQVMPVRRLRLGPFLSLDTKGMRLRVGEGFADTSPFRSHVETDAQSEVALRIDRVLSPWTPKQIEQALLGTQTFESVAIADHQSVVSPGAGDTSLLLGRAMGTATNGNQEIGMDYAIVDLGAEKLVARYVGTGERMAFNASVLRQSLSSLEGRRLVVEDPAPVDQIEWSVRGGADVQQAVPTPLGWIVEPSGRLGCQGLGSPNAISAASPAHDFTVTLRAAVWRSADVVPDTAALACSARRGSLGAGSYVLAADWLGVSYVIEGVFVRTNPEQILQLEVRSPSQRAEFARRLLAAWIRRVTQ